MVKGTSTSPISCFLKIGECIYVSFVKFLNNLKNLFRCLGFSVNNSALAGGREYTRLTQSRSLLKLGGGHMGACSLHCFISFRIYLKFSTIKK